MEESRWEKLKAAVGTFLALFVRWAVLMVERCSGAGGIVGGHYHLDGDLCGPAEQTEEGDSPAPASSSDHARRRPAISCMIVLPVGSPMASGALVENSS